MLEIQFICGLTGGGSYANSRGGALPAPRHKFRWIISMYYMILKCILLTILFFTKLHVLYICILPKTSNT